MRLLNAHIANFKGIKDMELSFEPGFNLIKGDNGAGKTSILEALAVGLGGFIAGIPGVNTRHFTQDEIRREYTRAGDGSCQEKHNTPVEVSLTACFRDDAEKVSWKRMRTSMQASRSTVQPREVVQIAEAMSNDPNVVLPLLGYQGAGRVWSQKRDKSMDVFAGRYLRTVGYTDTLLEASSTKFLLNWCVRMEQIAWQKDKEIREYEAAKRAVAGFMGYMDHGGIYRFFYDKQLGELMYEESGKIQAVADLSAGYQSLVWMVLDIAARMAMLNPMLLERITDTPGVVLIDELDMHLHPKWQWKVIHALRQTFPNVQFIAATHAPILFASSKDMHLIDIGTGLIRYEKSHYGIDVNSSLQSYQGAYDLPEEIRAAVDAFYNAMDREDYTSAKSILEDVAEKTAPEFPLIVDMRTMYDIETSWPEE